MQSFSSPASSLPVTNTTPEVAALLARTASGREAALRRARDNADMTIPSLIRREGDNATTDLQMPWDSTGAYLLNNLTNKIARSLFPAGITWANFSPSRSVLADLQNIPDPLDRDIAEAALNSALAQVERKDFAQAIVADGDISVLNRTCRHILCAGSYSIQFMASGKLRGRPLTHFTTERDGSGEIIAAALWDNIAYATAPPDVQELVKARSASAKTKSKKGMTPEDMAALAATPVTVVTYIRLTENARWSVHQETYGAIIEGTEATYAKADLPFMFPVYEMLDGEHFGRSYVEHYVADLQAVDGQSEVVQQSSILSAMLIRLVVPGGVTSKTALENARNGDVISGRAEDVATLRADKGSDMQTSIALTDRTISRLNQAFLTATSVQRQAERVTAEEIRFLAQELEAQLGGAYSDLVVSLQEPYARLKVSALQRQKRMPQWAKDEIDMTISTGAAALTRSAKTNSLFRGLGLLAQMAPQEMQRRLNVDTLVSLLEESEGYSYDGLLLTEDQANAKEQEAATQAMVSNAAPELIRQAGSLIGQQQPEPAPPETIQ